MYQLQATVQHLLEIKKVLGESIADNLPMRHYLGADIERKINRQPYQRGLRHTLSKNKEEGDELVQRNGFTRADFFDVIRSLFNIGVRVPDSVFDYKSIVFKILASLEVVIAVMDKIRDYVKNVVLADLSAIPVLYRLETNAFQSFTAIKQVRESTLHSLKVLQRPDPFLKGGIGFIVALSVVGEVSRELHHPHCVCDAH